MSDPTIYDENGRLRLELPDGRPDNRRVYPVAGAVLQGYVDQVNELRTERDQLRETLTSLLAEFGQDVHDERVLNTWSATLTTDEMAAYHEGRTSPPRRTEHP